MPPQPVAPRHEDPDTNCNLGVAGAGLETDLPPDAAVAVTSGNGRDPVQLASAKKASTGKL